MASLKAVLVIALTVLLSGCVPSLHPLYTESDLLFDPALIGSWAERGDEDTWRFQKAEKGDKTYKLICTEKGVPAEFSVHLVLAGKLRFLDIYPEEPQIKNDYYKVHLIPAHTFLRIRIVGDALHIAMMDGDRIKKGLNTGKLKLAHTRVDDWLVLTASTKELRQFAQKHGDDPAVFANESELHRLK
jgi:hypothetical protein